MYTKMRQKLKNKAPEGPQPMTAVFFAVLARGEPKEKSTHRFLYKCLIFLAPRHGIEPRT